MTEDNVAAEVQRRQQARLNRTARPWPNLSEGMPRKVMASRWQHVPLAEMFAELGNRLLPQRNGTYKSGHEPIHSSKSGTCLVVRPETGWWACSSCNQHGDAATLTMTVEGCTYREASRILTSKYGPPKGAPTPKRRVWTVEL